MHCFGAKPILANCHIDTKKYISVKFYLEIKSFHFRKCTWKCRQQNGGYFVSALCWIAVLYENFTLTMQKPIRTISCRDDPRLLAIIAAKHWPSTTYSWDVAMFQEHCDYFFNSRLTEDSPWDDTEASKIQFLTESLFLYPTIKYPIQILIWRYISWCNSGLQLVPTWEYQRVWYFFMYCKHIYKDPTLLK